VIEVEIKTGQAVLNDGNNNKLDPRYKGPFTIVKRDGNQNYILIDATGEILKCTIPRHKKKIIYKDIDENIWEPERNFNNMKTINDYLKKPSKNKVGRPKKSFLLHMVTVLLLIFTMGSAQKLTGREIDVILFGNNRTSFNRYRGCLQFSTDTVITRKFKGISENLTKEGNI
jgi:hypothetical protein